MWGRLIHNNAVVPPPTLSNTRQRIQVKVAGASAPAAFIIVTGFNTPRLAANL